jgi:predicted enzyme related to lactoylglutathione lyase
MATPGIRALGQVAIAVKDVDRAAAFYERVLGLTPLFRFPGLAFFDCGGVRLMLSKPEEPGFDKTSILYYRVDDIQAAVAAITGAGVPLVHEPRVVHRDARHELWMAFLQDTEGNHLALMCEVLAATA